MERRLSILCGESEILKSKDRRSNDRLLSLFSDIEDGSWDRICPVGGYLWSNRDRRKGHPVITLIFILGEV